MMAHDIPQGDFFRGITQHGRKGTAQSVSTVFFGMFIWTYIIATKLTTNTTSGSIFST